MKRLVARLLPLSMFAPAFAFAQAPDLSYFQTLILTISNIINTLIPILVALALLVFIWGVLKYFIFGAGDEGKRAEAKNVMIYGLGGLVLIVAVWGIVNLLVKILGVNTGTTVPVPTIPV